MTEEAKKNLLDYMLGKMPSESGVEEEIFQSINNIPRDDWENNDILPEHWNNFRYEGLIQVQNSELLVLYGGYKTTDDEVRGIITILNKDFKPLKSIYQYDSGTYLRYIQCMAQAEDNTFYAIDCPDFPRDEEWSFTTSQKRFLMFNNFTQQINNDYVLTLQKSYIFPTDYFNFYCKDMYKDVNSSNYVFTGVSLKDQNDPDFDSIRVINLKVNVGNENDWNKWDSDNNYWLYGASYVEFQDDNFFCRILLSQNIITNKNVSLWTKDFTQASFNLKTITTVNYYAVHDTSNYKNQSIFLNRNELYFVLNNQQWRLSNGQTMPKYIGLYYYNESTNQTQIIYEKYLGDYNFCNLEAIYIVKNNNDVYVQFNNNITQTNNDVFADYYLQRLVNDEWKPKLISSQQYFYYNRRALFVTNEFNLLNYVSYMINPQPQYWYIPNIKEIYNETNYNGEPFTDKNSLNSNSAILYSDNNPVFARNLYNKTQNGVTTMSTIEVPSNYLNDVLVDKMDLCSENNNVIISNTNGFTKNIYETVYLNFVNTISIVNNNGPQPIYNPTAATELNTSINNPEDYDNLKLTKYKINYQDGTNTVSNLQATLQDDGSYELLMTFFLNKTANSLELISEDEKTSYLTYNLRNVEINKFYSYNQRVRIGG
jgi:hypothetical protein|nr:MAG TPA: hypothetical protein [Caudoviricetes sp.]